MEEDSSNGVGLRLIERLQAVLESEKGEILKRMRVQSKIENFSVKKLKNKCEGDEIMKELRKTLKFFDEGGNEYGVKRSKHQKQFHEAFLGACARRIYKNEYKANYMRIMEENNWDEIKQEVLVCCPRRFGKTYAVNMFIAAVLWCVPEIEVLVFSPGKRQSVMILECVKKMLKMLDASGSRIIKSNQELLWVKGRNKDDIRKLSAFPANPKTLRGTGGDLIMLEEMAQIPEQLFFQVVVPLLELDRTCMIGISTIFGGDENFLNKYLKLKDTTGNPIFKSFQFFLACQACMDAGKAAMCTHKMNELPSWQSQRKHERIRAMMADQQELLLQETVGIGGTGSEKAFTANSVRSLIARPRFKDEITPKYVYLSVDPSGGGIDSDFAVCSMMYERGLCIILGGESVPAKDPEDCENTLDIHIKKLRLQPRLENVPIVVQIEGNLGFEAAHLCKFVCDKHKNIIIQRDDKQDGLRLDNKRKALMYSALRERLMSDAIVFHTNIISSMGQCKFIETIKDQLLNYRIISKLAENPFQVGKRTFSGKENGKDDLIIAVQMNLYYKMEFHKNTRYSQYW